MPDAALRGKVAVAGVGTTTYGRMHGYSAEDLGIWALDLALADAGLTRADIDGVIVSRIPDYQAFCEMTMISPRFACVTPGQGRMSGSSIEQGVLLIASGMCNTVAVVYGNNGRTAGAKYGGADDRYGGSGGGLSFPYGMTSPGAVHAMMF
jgi:acetyl-CoA acetyltransferase